MIERVNIGDTPAPAIATEALYKTAERFKEESPEAAELLKRSSYIDELIDSRPTLISALHVARETECMLDKGGFSVKGWHFSGEEIRRTNLAQFGYVSPSNNQRVVKSLSTDTNLRVLGLGWETRSDMILNEFTLNFSKKRRAIRTDVNLREFFSSNGITRIINKENSTRASHEDIRSPWTFKSLHSISKDILKRNMVKKTRLGYATSM